VEVSGSTLIIRAVGSGSAIITASQPGDNNYNAATQVQQTQQITKANQTITFAALASQTYSPNGVITLTASASSGLPVTYASSDSTVVQVSGNTLTIKKAGSATISASQPGDTNYNAAASVEQTQQITKANQTITFNPLLPKKILLNGTITLSATADSGLPVSYASSHSTVVQVSGNNLIMKATGSATITASQSGNNNYNAAASVERMQQIIRITTIVFRFI
jgi:hypothetical protein